MAEEVKYYSTNHNSELVSFKEALMKGQAPDKGLYMPEKIPTVDFSELAAFKDLPYHEIAFRVSRKFLQDQIDDENLKRIVKEAYNYPVPLEQVYDRKYVLRLDQGPTASFKDFAARMRARLMSQSRPKGERLNILVATSGDTGGAVADGFYSVEGVEVIILYPSGKVSPVQEKQLTTHGKNIHAHR